MYHVRGTLLTLLNQVNKKHLNDYLHSCHKGYARLRKDKHKGKAFHVNSATDGKKIARVKLNLYGSKSL